jgi:hypothetical protein
LSHGYLLIEENANDFASGASERESNLTRDHSLRWGLE